MEQYITADNEERLSPVVVVATMCIVGLFAFGFLYQIALLLL